MRELEPGATVLVAADNSASSLVFARIVCSFDGGTYCVELPNGQLARRQIPDVEAILPEWMATPAEVRSFISREFRRDLTVMRNQGKLTPGSARMFVPAKNCALTNLSG
jgi:hypothetical protein